VGGWTAVKRCFCRAEEVDGCGDGVNTLSLSACGVGVNGCGYKSVADND